MFRQPNIAILVLQTRKNKIILHDDGSLRQSKHVAAKCNEYIIMMMMMCYSDPTVDVRCFHFQVLLSCHSRYYVARVAVFTPPPPSQGTARKIFLCPYVVGVQAIVAPDRSH
jgi:hypothetical protein